MSKTWGSYVIDRFCLRVLLDRYCHCSFPFSSAYLVKRQCDYQIHHFLVCEALVQAKKLLFDVARKLSHPGIAERCRISCCGSSHSGQMMRRHNWYCCLASNAHQHLNLCRTKSNDVHAALETSSLGLSLAAVKAAESCVKNFCCESFVDRLL